MPDGQHGVDEQHAGAAPAHNGADLLTHFGLVAVYFAGGAKGFGFHKGAVFNALQGVIMQGLALRAQAAFRRMVVLRQYRAIISLSSSFSPSRFSATVCFAISSPSRSQQNGGGLLQRCVTRVLSGTARA